MKANTGDPILQWCAGHQDEIQAFEGQYVGISAKYGIVAHGLDFARVCEETLRKDPDAMFEFVPPAGPLVM